MIATFEGTVPDLLGSVRSSTTCTPYYFRTFVLLTQTVLVTLFYDMICVSYNNNVTLVVHVHVHVRVLVRRAGYFRALESKLVGAEFLELYLGNA